jgi:hypothetical protein
VDVTAVAPDLCQVCGLPIAVGQQPCITTIRPHEWVGSYRPFTPYFDFALGQEVTSHAHRWRLMKEAHVDYRDKMSPGDLSARLDRVEAQKREEARR